MRRIGAMWRLRRRRWPARLGLRHGPVRDGRPGGRAEAALLVALAVLLVAGPARTAGGEAATDRDRFDTVVIDPGHGGEDEGARGSGGLVEKDLVLDVSRRLAARLRAAGLRVVMTRDDDATVPLETRTAIANDAEGDLFVSVHANAAAVRGARGVETYFVALEASDAGARRVAARENQALGALPGPLSEEDPLVALLGDLIATEHVQESQVFARLAHEELAGASPAAGRGVKQAPFVVLMGVQMPAVLVELGFLSNPRDAAALGAGERREALARALARSVARFGRRYDAKRGLVSRVPEQGPDGSGTGAPEGEAGRPGPASGSAAGDADAQRRGGAAPSEPSAVGGS